MSVSSWGLLALLAAALWTACGNDDNAEETPAASPPFTSDDLARVDAIFERSCVACHREEGPAPFALSGGDQRRRRARQIAEVVQSGFMPPWLPTARGADLASSRRLPTEERDLMARWARSSKEGRDIAEPTAVEAAQAGGLGPPDLVLKVPGPVSIPAEGIGIQHTLVFDPELETARPLRAVQYRPSNPRALHGGALLLDGSGNARRMDQMSPEAGYRSPGGMGLALLGSLDAFSPGAVVQAWPDGLGPLLKPGQTISLELHLFPRGREETEQGELALWFQEPLSSVQRRSVVAVAMGSLLIDIPPFEADYRIRATMTLPVDADFVSCFPMARYVSRSVRLAVATPKGTKKVLLEIDDFDLNWVQRYQLEEPLRLPAGSVFELEMSYDNSAANPQNPRVPPGWVRAGMRAIDEAGFAVLHLAPREEAGRSALNELHVRGFQDRLAALRRARGR